MAILTQFGDPKEAKIQAESIVCYYERWHYFGLSADGQDTYAFLANDSMVNLSVVYTAEDGDYGSPCFYGILSNQWWYKYNSTVNYELAMKVANFLSTSNIKPWSVDNETSQ